MKQAKIIWLMGMIFLPMWLLAQTRPNIIFLLTDDHRWNAVGFMNNSIIHTPNLDKLAQKGAVFENAYATSSICCVSRASILTGQHLAKHKIGNFDTDLSQTQLEYSYPIVCKSAGYQIGFIGKYGVGLHHPDTAFDYWECPPTYQPDYETFDKDGKPVHHTDLVSGQIKEAITQFSAVDKPFCLSVSFKAPHCQDGDPRQFLYHPRYESLYKEDVIPKSKTTAPEYWEYFPDDFKQKNEARYRWTLRFDTDEKYQQMVKAYYRLITQVDDVVGEMVEELKKHGLDRNTIIIFMGDNGFFLGEHGLAGKWFAYEESIRVPLMIYDPRNPVGRRIRNMALNIDLSPTILEYAGAPIPPVIQGKPLQNLIRGKTKNWRTSFYYQFAFPPYKQKCEALVTENYKYIIYPKLNPVFEELYSVKKDPLETKNLVNDKKFQKKKSEMMKELEIAKKQAAI